VNKISKLFYAISLQLGLILLAVNIPTSLDRLIALYIQRKSLNIYSWFLYQNPILESIASISQMAYADDTYTLLVTLLTTILLDESAGI
jgi:hypothetical protein